MERLGNNEKIYEKAQLIPGAISLYKLQKEYFLPHIYFSTSTIPTVGKIRSLAPLTYTSYLDNYPAIAFTSQILEKGNLKKIINDNLLFVN